MSDRFDDLNAEIDYLRDDCRYLLGEVQDLRDVLDKVRRACELLAYGHPNGAQTMLGLPTDVRLRS